MKIILKNNSEIICFTQLKDIAYLGNVLDDQKYISKYVDLVNKGLNADDFVKITDSNVISILINHDEIVDYMSYRNMDAYSLSKMISINSFVGHDSSDKIKLVEDLQQLAKNSSYNKLKMPLLADGEIDIVSKDGLHFYSSVVPNYFVLKFDNGDLDDCLYSEFLDNCLNSVDADAIVSSRLNDKLVIKTSKRKKKLFKKTLKKS